MLLGKQIRRRKWLLHGRRFHTQCRVMELSFVQTVTIIAGTVNANIVI